MRFLFYLFATSIVFYWCDAGRAESASEIYQRRVVPLLQSSKASSCSECHLQGLQLEDFLTPDPKTTFASLRARGWIDVEHPSESKLLQFIAKQPTNSSELMDKVRKSELEAIGQWIRASVQDPDSLNEPQPKLNDLKLDEVLVRHARNDHVLSRFVDMVWSQLERCANCHSPDRNASQVEKNGKQMSWIVPNSPQETLHLLEDRKLINLENPEGSLLRTKALGLDEHGGGVKFPADGQTDREWNKFLKDYASIKRGLYEAASEIPSFDSIRTWRTGLHLKVKELPNLSPGQYAVILMHRISPSGSIDEKAIALGEGRVSKDGLSWSTSLMLVDPTRSRQTRGNVNWGSLLPDGKYQLRWILVPDARVSLQDILRMQSTGRVNLDSLWKVGHSSAKSIPYADFQVFDTKP